MPLLFGGVWFEPDPIVSDREVQFTLAAEEFHLHLGGSGMTGDIRQAFLHDAVDGCGDRFRERRGERRVDQ